MYNFKILVEWVKYWCETHPEWLNLHSANSQGKKRFVWKGGEMVETMDFDLYDKALWGPFKAIPNVRKFKVVLGKNDELYAKFGLKRKFSPQLLYETHTNSDMNVYALNQIKRLRIQAISDPKLYWRSVNTLLRYSNVFFIMGLMHVFPKWHRELPFWYVLRLWKQYKKISQLKSWEAIHKRVYIEKGNGKLRPLGVPADVWRIYLHNVANFLSLYLESRKAFTTSQHGFRTGLGTKSAWESIFQNVIGKADWVYEFDLKRCFPNIRVQTVSNALRRNEVPEGWVQKFQALNMTPVQNASKLKAEVLEANELNKKLEHDAEIWYKVAVGGFSLEELDNEGMDTSGISDQLLDTIQKFWNQDDRYEEGSSYFWNLLAGDDKVVNPNQDLNVDTSHRSNRGLPQGLPTSPILTILALEEMLIKRSNFSVLMYADDGIFYGKGEAPELEKLLPKIPEKHGIVFSPEKSKWAKLPGEPLDLKFLGLRWNNGVFSAETREGATLVFDKEEFVSVSAILNTLKPVLNRHANSADIKWELREEQLAEMGSLSSWELLVRSKVWGLIQSRMYQDSWLQEAVNQSFDLDWKPLSWVDRVKNKLDGLTVFNSTSYAANDLLCLLNARKNPGRSKKSTS